MAINPVSSGNKILPLIQQTQQDEKQQIHHKELEQPHWPQSPVMDEQVDISNNSPSLSPSDNNNNNSARQIGLPIDRSSENKDSLRVEYFQAPAFIRDLLVRSNAVWIHGPEGSGKRSVAHRFLQEEREKYTPVWIDAGEELADLSMRWIQTIKDLCPQWKGDLPPNYREALEKHWEEKNYLFVVHNVKLKHLRFLQQIMGLQRWIILSERPLFEKSFSISFDKKTAQQWIHQKGLDPALIAGFSDSYSFASSPLLLTIAASVYEKYKVQFLNEWTIYTQQAESPSFLCFLPQFLKAQGEQIDYSYLILMGSEPIKHDFFEKYLDSSTSVFENYHLIDLSDHHTFSLPVKIRREWETVPVDQNLKKQHIAHLATEFQKYVGSSFSQQHSWMIPHVRHLFEVYQRECGDEPIFPLFSLLWHIGNFYTQIDEGRIGKEKDAGPILAKHITVEARGALEKSVNALYKKETGEDKNIFLELAPQECVAFMDRIHPHLAHLYVNLHYQVGRSYFYIKDAIDAEGSKIVLNYAKEMAPFLYQGKETLLAKLIDRNGLFYHLNEEKRFKEAAEGYESLLKSGVVLDIRYDQMDPILLYLDQDLALKKN